MNGAAAIFKVRLQILRNKLLNIRQHSLLKIVVVWLMIIGIFIGMFYVPLRAFLFLKSMGHIGVVIIDRLMYLFFMGLFIMLIFSNCIICYSTSYKSQETEHLFTLPIKVRDIFLVKFIDSIILSSWTFLCFLVPIMSAYAVVRGLGLLFYFSLMAFFVPFVVIAGAIGCLGVILMARFMPRKVYQFLGYFLVICFLIALVLILIKSKVATQREDDFLFLLTNLIPHFGFTQFAFAPNYWISEGIFKVIAGDFKNSLFWWLLLLSNALFLGQITLLGARKFYYRGWQKNIFSSELKNYYSGKSRLDKLFKRLSFIDPKMRSLALKDIKVFWRDPLQWSQFTIFFGLLAIYFANIRSLGYERVLPFWKNIISFLNLASTNLTLASLSVRFVFPQFSLEGRRFWILGLAPIKTRALLYEKFWLNSIAALCISLPLIILSNFMLKVSWPLMFLSIFVVILMGLSLTSLCIGLGAIFPNFKEDNPAQIVSGFGGTLALVLCLLYIVLSVGALAIPFHLLYTQAVPQAFFRKLLFGASAFVLILSLGVIFLSISFGCRAIEKMEI